MKISKAKRDSRREFYNTKLACPMCGEATNTIGHFYLGVWLCETIKLGYGLIINEINLERKVER